MGDWDLGLAFQIDENGSLRKGGPVSGQNHQKVELIIQEKEPPAPRRPHPQPPYSLLFFNQPPTRCKLTPFGGFPGTAGASWGAPGHPRCPRRKVHSRLSPQLRARPGGINAVGTVRIQIRREGMPGLQPGVHTCLQVSLAASSV